jgi:hypothetical protein
VSAGSASRRVRCSAQSSLRLLPSALRRAPKTCSTHDSSACGISVRFSPRGIAVVRCAGGSPCRGFRPRPCRGFASLRQIRRERVMADQCLRPFREHLVRTGDAAHRRLQRFTTPQGSRKPARDRPGRPADRSARSTRHFPEYQAHQELPRLELLAAHLDRHVEKIDLRLRGWPGESA